MGLMHALHCMTLKFRVFIVFPLFAGVSDKYLYSYNYGMRKEVWQRISVTLLIVSIVPLCSIFRFTIFSSPGNRCFAQKYFWNLIKSNRNQIVFIIFRLIWNETNIRLVPDQSENDKYNLIWIWFNKISKRFLCVCTRVE